MSEHLDSIRSLFQEEIQKCASDQDLEALRVKYLGRKQGLVTNALKLLATLPKEEKGAFERELTFSRMKSPTSSTRRLKIFQKQSWHQSH